MKKIVLGISILLVFGSCNKKSNSDYVSISGFTQGTTYSITYESPGNINYQDEIENLLAEFDTSLSTYNKLSVITAINNNSTKKVDHYLKTVFIRSQEISKLTDGAFDITVGPLVNAWGFGLQEREKISQSKIDSILEFVGYQKVKLLGDTVFKKDPRIKIDMNAIAQGYAVDVVSDFIEKQNIENYLVEIGGEVRTKGLNPKKEAWKIGIDKPIDNNNLPGDEMQAIVHLSGRSLATSGNYRKFYELNGVKYSHTIDPKTGYPVNHSLLSATVIADDCMTADAFATAFMVVGLDLSIELIENNPGIEAYFIYSNNEGKFKVKSTPGIEEIIEEL